MIDAPSAVLRKAKMSDAAAIQRLITIFALRDEMLHRSLDEVYENIRNFFVVEVEEPVPAVDAGVSGRELTVLTGTAAMRLSDVPASSAGANIAACGALQIGWGNLAEIKSLAVAESHQGRGFGRQIVLACLEEGRTLGLGRVFALTYKPGFFEKLGFQIVDKATLPHKVWTECIRCPKFPDCGEIAVVVDLAG
jgi:amino-acid N-acetyltransferase